MAMRKMKSSASTKVDMTVLQEKDRAAIQEAARAVVAKERRQVAEKVLLEQEIEAERAKYDPDLQKFPLVIDLPAFASYMLIDGARIYHGESIMVTQIQRASLVEQMDHMWRHEREAGNPNMSRYTPVRAAHVSGDDVITRV